VCVLSACVCLYLCLCVHLCVSVCVCACRATGRHGKQEKWPFLNNKLRKQAILRGAGSQESQCKTTNVIAEGRRFRREKDNPSHEDSRAS